MAMLTFLLEEAKRRKFYTDNGRKNAPTKQTSFFSMQVTDMHGDLNSVVAVKALPFKDL